MTEQTQTTDTPLPGSNRADCLVGAETGNEKREIAVCTVMILATLVLLHLVGIIGL